MASNFVSSGGELEFRFADALPRLFHSRPLAKARIGAGQWRHLTLVYSGVADKDAMRVHSRSGADVRRWP